MDKKKLIIEKQKKLVKINDSLNEGLKPSFGKLFMGPFIFAVVGFILSSLLKLSMTQVLGLVIGGYFLALFILSLRENKRIEKEKAELINKRLVIQQEIVALIREIKNEDSKI